MFAHVTIRVADRAASQRFYRTVLEAIGIEPTQERARFIAWGDFVLMPAIGERRPTRHLHTGFVAQSREAVDAFWRAGIDAGYRDDGAPGDRPEYGDDYYGGFLLDPDGNSVEAVHAGDRPDSGHVDHLWIGVRDLDASVAFYELISGYAGLRAEPRQGRRQYRGATGATFSLLADGRPPTAGLHIAFPAPDRRTVDEFHAAATAAGYAHEGGGDVLDPDGTKVELVFRVAR